MKDNRKPFTHGELLFVPKSEMPNKAEPKTSKNYIVGHSETGHHHVLTSKKEFTVEEIGDSVAKYLELQAEGELVHKKTSDKHETRILEKGVWGVFFKKEYDYKENVMKRVYD